MKTLDITRYLQESYQCAVSASASIANYYNQDIDYKLTQKIAKKFINKRLSDGLYTPDIGILLNYLGFSRVVIVSSDLNYLSYNWKKYSKRNIINELQKSKVEGEYKIVKKKMVKFLSHKSLNKIIIDYNFKHYITTSLDDEKPVMLSFNWNMYFKYGGIYDLQEHAVCCNGYDNAGVSIVDSHNEGDQYLNQVYNSGTYVMQWEHLLSCMGFGDIIIADKYNKRNFNNILKQL